MASSTRLLQDADFSQEAKGLRPGLGSLHLGWSPFSTTFELGSWTNPSAPQCRDLGVPWEQLPSPQGYSHGAGEACHELRL